MRQLEELQVVQSIPMPQITVENLRRVVEAWGETCPALCRIAIEVAGGTVRWYKRKGKWENTGGGRRSQ